METPQDVINNLQPISFDDFDIIHNYLKKTESENCDYNICNIMSWGMKYELKYSIYKDNIFFLNPHYPYLLTPSLEGISAEELYKIYRSFAEKYPEVIITPIPEKYITSIKDLDKYFSVLNDDNWNDYVYLSENLVNLSGKTLAKKKNLIAQFCKLYPDFRAVPISADDYQEVVDFCSNWAKTHNLDDKYLRAELQAIQIVLQRWSLFPARGLKLYANDRLCAFAIWSPQNSEMATVHFEKSDVSIKGAGQMINYLTAKEIAPLFRYINREQDMGLEGIRHAKRSYMPVKMVGFYRIIPLS